MQPVRILLADDHTLVREMLAQRLDEEPGFAVVGAACDGSEAVALARSLKPDVVVLDIDMPGLSAFEAARAIRADNRGIRVMFLTAFVQDGYIDQALGCEASGYAVKGMNLEVLFGCLRRIAAGRTCFAPEVQRRIVVDDNGARLSGGLQSRMRSLTDRELQVLTRIAGGLSKKEIAREMGISAKTVERHVSHLMEKLDIHDRVALARFAIREGLLNP